MTLQPGVVTLKDIVARGVLVQWFEGVALMSEVCAVVQAQPHGFAPPDAGSTWIAADGAVSAGPGAPGEAPVHRLGRLLGDLIAHDTHVPPPLKACIAEATAPSSPIASVQALYERLGYFERPDRRGLIRAIHERYLLTPAASRPEAPAAPEESALPKASARAGRRRPWAPLAAAVVVAAAIAASYLALSGRERAADSAAEAPAAAESPTAAKPGGARNPPRRGPAAMPPRGATPAQTNTRTPVTGGEAPLQSRTLMDFGSREWRWSWSEAPSGVETAAPPESERPRVSAYERVEVVANAIYSSADPNVEAPEMVYPQLPPVPPDTADATAVNALQVVIGEDGSVERVRLVSTPRQMTDMLLLSAARTWRFTPARLNGVPVRYRATIRWAAEYPDRR